MDADAETVLFIELATTPATTVDELTAVFGPGRTAAPGPHQLAATIIFDEVLPRDAARGCTVFARLTDRDSVSPDARHEDVAAV